MTEETAYSHFNKDRLLTTYGDLLTYDLDLEPWELSNILQHLKVDETSWSSDDFTVKGYKHYDEDGNSYSVGLLKINAKGRSKQDFLELTEIWNEAESDWESAL